MSPKSTSYRSVGVHVIMISQPIASLLVYGHLAMLMVFRVRDLTNTYAKVVAVCLVARMMTCIHFSNNNNNKKKSKPVKAAA